MTDRLTVVRDVFAAYESADRGVVERHLADAFTFSAPPDVGIDRATYFERCWPNSQSTEAFEYKRLFEKDGEVFVTYEATKTDGRRFRNTEVFAFDGGQISRVEVYFGWTWSEGGGEPARSCKPRPSPCVRGLRRATLGGCAGSGLWRC